MNKVIITNEHAYYKSCNKINTIKFSAGVFNTNSRESIYILVWQTEFAPPTFFGNHILPTDKLINQIVENYFKAVDWRSIKFFFRHVKSDFYPKGEKLYLHDFFAQADFHEVLIGEKIVTKSIKFLWKKFEIETGTTLISKDRKPALLEDTLILSELFEIDLKDRENRSPWYD